MKLMMRCAAVLCVLAMGTSAGAETLVEYDFSDIPADTITESVEADVIAPGVAADPLTRGPGIEPVSGEMSINSDDFTTEASPDPDDYYQFVVAPDAGLPLLFDELAFTARRSPAGPTAYSVFAGVGDFDDPEPLALQALSGDFDDNFRATIGLSGVAALQGVTVPVIFRIFAFGAESALGTFRIGLDPDEANADLPANLVVTGTVVPEPSSLALVGAGLIGLVGIARRRRRP